ncbi:MAG TPA: YgiT-type zinc finger protein [Anaerolineales bacterium]|nr:YgiT-type zinc finger protein [Anaerolineales bacterium]
MARKRNYDPEASGIPCPECHTGVLHLQRLTYFTWLNAELISVPNFPAWVCDLCGRRDFDPRAKKWLNTLLIADTSKRSGQRRNFPFQGDRIPPN